MNHGSQYCHCNRPAPRYMEQELSRKWTGQVWNEQVQQYENRYAQIKTCLLSEMQCSGLQWMREQAFGSTWLLQAPSGSGKSVLIVKYACDHLITARNAAQAGGDALPDLRGGAQRGIAAASCP